MTSWKRLLWKPSVIISLLLILSIMGIGLWIWYDDSDPQGGQGFLCDNVEFSPIQNASGWTVSGHNTVCSGFGGSSAIYIYVHPTGQSENREFLVFRYFEHGGANLPTIEWLGENKLSIRVEHVSEITKMKSSIGPVRILYQVDKEDYPRAR